MVIQVVGRDMAFVCIRDGMKDITEPAKAHHYITIEYRLKALKVHADVHCDLPGGNLVDIHTFLQPLCCDSGTFQRWLVPERSSSELL